MHACMPARMKKATPHLQCGQICQYDPLQVDLFFDILRRVEDVLAAAAVVNCLLPDRHADVENLRGDVCIVLDVDDEDVALVLMQNRGQRVNKELVQWGQEGRLRHLIESNRYTVTKHVLCDEAEL